MFLSNRCSRSSSRILGATSRAPHSRTDCSSSRCSSLRSKSSIGHSSANDTDCGPYGSALRVQPRDLNDRTTAHPERRGRTAPIDGQFEMIATAKEATDLSRADVEVGSNDASNGVTTRIESDSLTASEGFECAAVDVRDQIAESIDEQDDSSELI